MPDTVLKGNSPAAVLLLFGCMSFSWLVRQPDGEKVAWERPEEQKSPGRGIDPDGALFCTIKKALPPNRLVNFPLSQGSSRDFFASVVLPCITGEAWCYPIPAFASASGPSALAALRALRTGSLAAQLAACLPVPASRLRRRLIPLLTGQHLTPTGVGSATPLLRDPFQRPSSFYLYYTTL